MTDSPHIVILDEANFVDVVVEGSANQPVLVDFWADWCGPCKSLMPILEKLAVEYDGQFILAKLDTEAHPGIAQQLGIRSLPTVKLFKDRQLVDEFMGALPEGEVRAFLDKHVEPAADSEPAMDSTVEQAMALFSSGQTEEAKALLTQAQAADPANVDILLALGQVCVATNDLDTAESCLNALPEDIREGMQGKRLSASINLTRETGGEQLERESLEAAIAADDNNSEARYKLALLTATEGDVQQAMDNLLVILQKDPGYNDEAPRKKLLEMFDVLGDDPLAGTYRRKMFTLLH
ncbi:MAG: thioredoxin [Gammaproteobacteria bacterium]|nr:thioredoxin [Gammaproteobacteria bacterium]